jgi:hypothetical protein
MQIKAAVAKIVFAVYFDPVDWWRAVEKVTMPTPRGADADGVAVLL